jgi:hypothetical protein
MRINTQVGVNSGRNWRDRCHNNSRLAELVDSQHINVMTSFASMFSGAEFRRIFSTRPFVLQLLALGLAGVLNAQTLTDIHTAPSPGTNDICQL